MRILRSFLYATVFLSVSLIARADTYQFVYTGISSETFQLNSTTVPTRTDSGAFYIDVTDSVTSSNYTVGFGDFADQDVFGIGSDTSLFIGDGFVGVNGSATLIGFDFASSPFYTGSLADPTFNLGTFSDGAGDKLVVTDLTRSTAVPELSPVLLFGTGLLGFAGAVRRRFRS